MLFVIVAYATACIYVHYPHKAPKNQKQQVTIDSCSSFMKCLANDFETKNWTYEEDTLYTGITKELKEASVIEEESLVPDEEIRKFYSNGTFKISHSINYYPRSNEEEYILYLSNSDTVSHVVFKHTFLQSTKEDISKHYVKNYDTRIVYVNIAQDKKIDLNKNDLQYLTQIYNKRFETDAIKKEAKEDKIREEQQKIKHTQDSIAAIEKHNKQLIEKQESDSIETARMQKLHDLYFKDCKK